MEYKEMRIGVSWVCACSHVNKVAFVFTTESLFSFIFIVKHNYQYILGISVLFFWSKSKFRATKD